MRTKLRRALYVVSVVVLVPLAAHVGVRRWAHLEPPELSLPPDGSPSGASLKQEKGRRAVRTLGSSYAVERGKLLEVGLRGSPETIGYRHARLLYGRMVDNEGVLLRRFTEFVPSRLAQTALLDLAQLRYRNVDRGMAPDRLREIAAGARGFQPDPYADFFPTFQRFVYLNALYDMALSFERSPLIGCTSFVSTGDASVDGSALLARNFDFEVDSIFDAGKAIFFVAEDGKLPFASVAWPGLVGVVSGMNLTGLAAVVHGARAGEPGATGEPVVHALRRILQTTTVVDGAVRALAEQEPMVSHIVVLVDASGAARAVERVPGREQHVRVLARRAAVTNHLVGPAAKDEKNVHVLETTSSRARERRAAELVRGAAPATAATAVAWLRDRRAAGSRPLTLGDRDAIDALIATHGVVMDASTKTLWVSEGPHLLGRFVAFSLGERFAADYDPAQAAAPRTIPADPLLKSAELARYRDGR
ncbi:MAG TPA: C45 family peptidase [Polyangiaceae bacterium]